MSVLIGNEVLENSLEGYGARGTLASDPTTGTTFTTTTGHGARFPAVATGQILRLQCDDEIVHCTAHTASSETFTVLRGQEGTSNVAHAALAPVNAVVTAASMKRVAQLSLPRKPYYISGSYYGPAVVPDYSGGTSANGNMYLTEFPVTADVTLDRLAINCHTTGSAGSVCRLGIYRDNGAIGPDALVLDAGTVDTSTTGRKEATISQALTPDLYWLAVVAQGAPATNPAIGRTVPNTQRGMQWGTPHGHSSNFTINIVAFMRAGITGALPSTLTPVQADFQSTTESRHVLARVA